MKPKKKIERKKRGGSSRAARGSASGPKFKVGDRVSVPVRFGETGTVKELKDGRYGVEFHNLPFTLWYDENELRPQVGQGFSWVR